MRLSSFAPITAVTVAVGLSQSTAHADTDTVGSKALADVEAAMNKAKSHYFEYEATTTEAGKDEKKSAFNVWAKGEKRLTVFVAPVDLKGTKVLILSPTEMYVYLPAFGKVRRIANQTSDQSAFGMAFSQDDLATQKYSNSYAAALDTLSDKETKITLTALADKTTSYPRIQMTIARDKNVPTEIKYFNADGKLARTETRSGYTCESDVCTPGTLKMVDHTKGLTTSLARKKWKVNEPISDDTFSKRNLEK